jgi:excinuclease ABC subunit C
VCGWSGGVLVHFGIRDGRLCQWSQRKCSRPGATPQLAATPVGWRGFAPRNAELAAALVERSGGHQPTSI